MAKIVGMGIKIKFPPKKQATPFPPLNFSHIGKIWPIIETVKKINLYSIDNNIIDINNSSLGYKHF